MHRPLLQVSARILRWGVLVFFGGLLALGCNLSGDQSRGYLQGQITVRSDVDASDDYSGFRVLVLEAEGRSLDTLASAETDREGRFATPVTAPERGIYTLTVWGRRGREKLASTDYVVADGDSATLNLTLPLRGRRVGVRSQENAALDAYRNTLAQHRRSLVKDLQSDATTSDAMSRRIRQTSSVLWRLQETFPGTYASELAAIESLSLLAGWDDSLVVERVHSIEPTNPRYVEGVQIGRRAAARFEGQAAALDLLDTFAARARTGVQRAGVEAARIQLFIDSLDAEAALSAAEDLRTNHPNTKWAEWADRATYEVKNLLPGMEAPPLSARTLAGDSLSLRALRGRPVVLEFFAPGDDLYGRQLATRNALYRGTRADSVAFVSVSVRPDTLLYRALVNNRSHPGHSVIAPEGREDPIVEAYNVARVPTRFLIDAEGRLVGRYQGSAFLALQEDLATLVDRSLPVDQK